MLNFLDYLPEKDSDAWSRASIKNAWLGTSTRPEFFMTWLLKKRRNKFTFIFVIALDVFETLQSGFPSVIHPRTETCATDVSNLYPRQLQSPIH
jgi:hypothetical protein